MKFLGKWSTLVIGLFVFAFFLMRELSLFEAVVLIQLLSLNETIGRFVQNKKLERECR